MVEDSLAEQRFARLNRVARAIRNVIQLLTREKDPRHLIEHSCQMLTETIGYPTAWIALMDTEGRVTASAGGGHGDSFGRFQEELRRGDFPRCMKKALETEGIVVFENPRSECPACPLSAGYVDRAVFGICIRHNGRKWGVMTVTVPRSLAGDSEERELFAELAGDLGFALHRIEDEEQLRLHAMILGEIRDLVTLTDPDGRILYTNAAENIALQRDPGQLVGQTVDVFGDDPESGMTQREIVRKVLADGQWRGEMINFAADGTLLYLDCNVWVIRDAAGSPKYLCGVSRDITSAKQADRALRESHQKLDSIFRAAPVGIGLVCRRVLLEVNETLCRITGYCRDELVGQSARLLYPSDEMFEYVGREKYRQIAEQGTGTVETRWRKKDGTLIHVLLSSTPLDSRDLEKGVTFTALDISERKRIETALRESERQLSTLMKNLPGMVYRCRNDSQWTMEFVSEGCRSLTGYAPEEIMQNSVVSYASLIHPEDREKVWVDVQRGVREGTPFQTTYRIVDRSGSVKWVWEQGCGIFLDETLMALEGFITDITERKRAEEEHRRLEQQIQQTQKLESLGVLAGGIAHDFNNILMAVLGHAELALDDLSPMSPARERIREIETAARRAAELCRQMLAYSGKATFAREPVNLRELIEEMVHLLKTSITKKAVLNLHLAGDIPVIQADPSQLRQVVMNLIINASDALGDRDGAITISAGAIPCDADYLRATYLDNDLEPGLYAYLEVMDSGCGMDANTLRRIFEPFFTTKFSGRGLGLAAVLGIVRAHKGAVRVYSEPGKGTSFRVLFPASEDVQSPVSSPTSTAAEPWRGRGTILFVDDEPILRSLGERMLKQLGFNVLVAADGCEAVELFTLRGNEIDLVLMDLTMPRMDGAEAFEELRRLNPRVKVILVSGFSEEDVAARFSGKGLIAVLQKPYRLAVLRHHLAAALEEPGH